MFWSSGYRCIAYTDSDHLSKSAGDAFGLPLTKALAPTTRSSSCWIACLRLEAISAEAKWNASRALSTSECATERAPTNDASVPASTSSAAPAAQTLLWPRPSVFRRRSPPRREVDNDGAPDGEAAVGPWVWLSGTIVVACGLVCRLENRTGTQASLEAPPPLDR